MVRGTPDCPDVLFCRLPYIFVDLASEGSVASAGVLASRAFSMRGPETPRGGHSVRTISAPPLVTSLASTHISSRSVQCGTSASPWSQMGWEWVGLGHPDNMF